MTLVRFTPQGPMTSGRPGFDTLMDHFINDTARWTPQIQEGWAPPVDVREIADAYELRAELPGLSREDVKLTYTDGVLTLEGEKRDQRTEDEREQCYCVERRYGRFSRSFRLAREVQSAQIRAEFANGVLTITIPKAESSKPRMIDISMN